MTGFEVDPAELHDVARQVDSLVQDIEGEASLKWYANSAEVGHISLALALSAFQEDAQQVAELLKAAGAEAVSRLRQTADGYQGNEDCLVDAFRESRVSGPDGWRYE